MEKNQVICCVDGYNVFWYAGRSHFVLNPADAMLVTVETANEIIQWYHNYNCFTVEAAILPKRLSYWSRFLLWLTTEIRKRFIHGSGGFRIP